MVFRYNELGTSFGICLLTVLLLVEPSSMLWLASKKFVGDRDLAAAVVAIAIRARMISSICSGVVGNT